MAALMTRAPPSVLPGFDPTMTAPQSQRKPARKLSFLSLRKKSFTVDIPHSSTTSNPSRSPSGSKSASPSAYHGYEDPSKPAFSRPTELAHGRKFSRSSTHTHDEPSHTGRKAKERYHHEKRREQPVEQESYIFPSVVDEPSPSRGSHSMHRWRVRSNTGPSHRQDWESPLITNRPLKYSILDSASSVLSQYEDAPQTPVDDLSFRDPVFSIPVMVAAPVSGVETMDALVDGMNHHSHFGVDDHFMGMGGMSGRKLSKSGYHPLYHPPLPTPPPGVILGKAPLSSRTKSPDSDEDDDKPRSPSAKRPSQHRKRRPGSSRTPSVTTTADFSVLARPSTASSVTKTVAPSISEIIRTHAPPSQQTRSRRTSFCQSQGHTTVHEAEELDTEPQRTEDEGDIISRSSIDTIAEEVRRTIHNQKRSSISPSGLQRPRSFQHHQITSIISDNTRSLCSPRSEGRRESSVFSYSTLSDQPPLPALDLRGLTKVPTNSPSQTIAQYLRSARLTTLLTLTRRPHASREAPLNVSLSDLGSATGYPIVVFLGLGCVRHIMGLYDEMAECLGIRLITIDRWGLGRTDTPRSKSTRGIPEWASVVEEVLDQMHIDQCSVMAHSAGAPYALAFANKYPERIRGDICLLAPWVGGGEGAGYRWLKYVPNGILKTAQAAEWKVQAWMIGKPPTFVFEGIGFDAKSAPPTPSTARPPRTPTSATSTPANAAATLLSSKQESEPRPSMSSGAFSEYDDLCDFEGRFESRSTLERRSINSQRTRTNSDTKSPKRKPSRGFLGRLKSSQSSPQPQTPPEEKASGTGRGNKLKALRSMGSLRSKSRPSFSRATCQPSQAPSLPPPPSTDVGLGLDDLDWAASPRLKASSSPSTMKGSPFKSTPASFDLSADDHSMYSRTNRRRSISFGATESSTHFPSSPSPSNVPTSANFQAALGNALIAASHAESSKGTHSDLLQILNHDRQPWGFSYSAYPHTVRIWFGDKDERIAENAVRWMESAMGPEKCKVEVVKDADHALMYKSGLVVDVLEQICGYWRDYD
ncbi:predicted protein [Sparassis crispa]|uniref:AB hydrolase-1 domain-containing protein n=1 Tax=Sparassis crispa TaxID=139825 RepID=A0A401G7Q7_9APHY|nr:predicted protein [Sparassis crispa]GBE78189.1 predicted protein [Sparassis crispa]